MRDLYEYGGLKYVVTMTMSISALFIASGAIVTLQLLGVTASIVMPFYWLLYGLVALSFGILLAGISHTIFRLGLIQWMPIYTKTIIPLLIGCAVCASIAHTLISLYNKPTVALYVLLIATAFGAILWTRISAIVLRFALGTKKTLLRKLERCSDFENRGDISRIKQSLRMALGDVPSVPTTNQRGFVMAGLSSKPWHDSKDYQWKSSFEEDFAAIQQEALNAVNGQTLHAYNYPGAVDGSWNSLMLVKRGRLVEKNCALVPVIMDHLKRVPSFPVFREAQISVLGPGSRIKEHRDSGNSHITAQLAISIPDNCGICVAGETREWEEGKFLFFSTEYEHSAWNNSDGIRVVLIIDFLHPEITRAEAEYLGVGASQ